LSWVEPFPRPPTRWRRIGPSWPRWVVPQGPLPGPRTSRDGRTAGAVGGHGAPHPSSHSGDGDGSWRWLGPLPARPGGGGPALRPGLVRRRCGCPGPDDESLRGSTPSGGGGACLGGGEAGHGGPPGSPLTPSAGACPGHPGLRCGRDAPPGFRGTRVEDHHRGGGATGLLPLRGVPHGGGGVAGVRDQGASLASRNRPCGPPRPSRTPPGPRHPKPSQPWPSGSTTPSPGA